MDDSKALLRRLNDLRAIAVSQAARVTKRKLSQEAKRRWAIVEQVADIRKQLVPIEDAPPAELSVLNALNAQIGAIEEKIQATQQKDDAFAARTQRRSMAQWIRYDREEKARTRARSQLARLHQSEQPETSSPERNILALLNRILEEENISLETWLGDHRITRSSFMDWKAASGKPVKGKVSVAKARDFEKAIRQQAKELRLITVHDNVHDV